MADAWERAWTYIDLPRDMVEAITAEARHVAILPHAGGVSGLARPLVWRVVFSSILSTSALLGGSRYSPQTSPARPSNSG
jgi:hypothetical protein